MTKLQFIEAIFGTIFGLIGIVFTLGLVFTGDFSQATVIGALFLPLGLWLGNR